MSAIWFSILCGLVAIAYGAWSVRWILSQPQGNERMREIAAAIQQGATAYLNRQYSIIGIVGVVLFLALGIGLDWLTATGFLIGAIMTCRRNKVANANLNNQGGAYQRAGKKNGPFKF